MKTVRKPLKLGLVILLVSFIITTVAPGFKPQARASDAGAFFGGMMAGHVIGGAVRRSRLRTAAMMDMAYRPKSQTVHVQQQPTATSYPAQVPAHSHPAETAKPTVEQRIKELDKLAAGGYITPQEYKAKKQAILDSL